MKVEDLTIAKIASDLRKKEYSAVELATAYLDNIDQDKTNSFITVDRDYTIEQAKLADDALKQNKASALTGVPIAIKDVLTTKGLLTTAASKALQNYIPPYTATAVKRLLNQGMVTLGKTNCDEFAMGASNENSAYGNVLNPHDPTKVPGGSSGGSAVAVADHLAPVALGTDTGGSVRQPASFCGVVGLKPTYGRVSRYGLIAMTSSFDTVGVLSKTAEDCALILQSMAGRDGKDSTSANHPVEDFHTQTVKPLDKLTIGLPKQYFIDGMDERIRKLIEQAVEKLKKKGHTFKEVDLPHTQYGLAVYYIIVPSEVSSNLARYDGIRYGFHVEDKTLLDQYKKTRSFGFGPETRRRIMLGTFALSSGYYDAYYLQAQRVRTLIKQDFDQAFKDVDLILTPTTPTTAFKIGEKSDPLTMYLSDIFTVSANIAGIPGVSVPVGKVDGMPAGMQLLGPHWSEGKLLNLAHHWQILDNQLS